VPFTPKRMGSLAYSLVMFLVVSVLAGVLVAGLFIPFAGMAGATSNAAAAELESLPAELATPVPATRSKVLMGNGKTLAYFYDENRIPVKLKNIAPIMRQAQIAIEDHRFYEHGALDFKGTMRALVRNTAGNGITQGGSSLTQQYVKMVQIEACQAKGDSECVREAQETTVQRKIRELRYAIAMEKKFTKDQILERYLNIAYYGDGAYGVESAARHYFSTSAAKLNLPQAAMLAGLVQNPDAQNPVNNTSAALERRDVVLNRMVELKLISLYQAREAKKVGFDQDKVKSTRNGCVGTRYPFLCDYVRRTLLRTPSLGKTEDDRENMINRGGLVIQTAIDPKTQDLAEQKVSSVVGPRDPVISTMNMIQPGTGLIIAMAQSRPEMGSDAKKGQTYWNLAADPAMGGIQGYQAGSTFKLFTLAAALEKGIPISKRFNARSPMNFTGRPFTSCKGRERIWDRWVVRNAVGHSKNIGMMEATQFSVNTYFIQLELATGMCRVTKMADRTGVKVGARIGQPPVDIVKEYQDKPSFTLGTVEVSPLSMAEAYATFAARGIHCDPIIISKITTRSGKNLEAPDANCRRVVDKDVADGVNRVLKSVVDKGTGRRAKISDGRDIAGKTGTIDSNEAVWFAGYTPEIAGVAMISVDNTKSPFKKRSGYYRRGGVKGYRVPSTGVYLEGSGSGDAGAKIWRPVMQKYFQQIPKTGFNQPPRKIQVGKQIKVPGLNGLSISAATRKLERMGFTVEKRYTYSDRVPKYGFMGWSPSPGSWIAEFGTIYAVYSNGRDPEEVAREKAEAKRKAEERRRRQQQSQPEPTQPQPTPPRQGPR
jgi:membrane peptidoglycan carboxypeptidase